MPRFFLPEWMPQEDELPKQILLDGEDAFHLSVSLRARIGDEVTVCSGTGVEYRCKIFEISGGKKNPQVILTPISSKPSENESPVEITLFQGMPKGKKTDTILQKCTELGVSRVVFVDTDHSVPTWDRDEKKIARFEKIAMEAAKQCGRGKLVSVDVLPSLDKAIPIMKESQTCFACYEKEGKLSLKQILSSGQFHSASFFVGPEGGISQREVALLEEAGIPTVTLGKRILRTETAGEAVLSMFLYEKELL